MIDPWQEIIEESQWFLFLRRTTLLHIPLTKVARLSTATFFTSMMFQTTRVTSAAVVGAVVFSCHLTFTEAFVPHHHQTPTIGSSTFLPGRSTSYQHAPLVTAPRSTSALQMNLFDRFSRVAKANLNNILQSLEDPEKIMNQALEDMQVRARES